MSVVETPRPDEDKWRLRARMTELVGPLQENRPAPDTKDPTGTATFERFETLFRPRPAAPINRSPLMRIWTRLSLLVRPLPRGVNDNLAATSRSFETLRSHLLDGAAGALNSVRTQLGRMRRFTPLLRRYLGLRRVDLIGVPLAVGFFIAPLLIMLQFEKNPNATTLGFTLISASLATSLIIGPRFGTLATLSSLTWLSLTAFKPVPDLSVQDALVHWMLLIVSGLALALLSIALGIAGLIVRNLFQLALRVSGREADISELQSRLSRARHSDAILAYIVGYCRDTLKRKAIFLALDESAVETDQDNAFDIAAQLKSIGYARVCVDRKSYLPRAIQSFSSSGFKAYPLETPSGTIALLGLEQTSGKKLSPIDERYLKLILVTAAYALERLTLIEKVDKLEESQIEFKSRNAALIGLIGNLSSTTSNLDDQAYALHQLLDREAYKPYDTAINFIRRNISALRNSIALIRDVVS